MFIDGKFGLATLGSTPNLKVLEAFSLALGGMLRRLSIVSVPERASVRLLSGVEGTRSMLRKGLVEEVDGDDLIIVCADGRARPLGVDLNKTTIHRLRAPGGVLSPVVAYSLLEQSSWGKRRLRKKRDQRLVKEALAEADLEMTLLMIRLKSPKRVIIVTHEHCAAVNMLCYDPTALHREVNLLVQRLVDAKVTIPILALHDKHCQEGCSHESLLICAANVPEQAQEAKAA